jgi:hypothetical protein
MLAALLLAAATSAACALEVRGFPQGELLARLPLPDRGFALRYMHSVTLREVESRFEIRAGRIVQTAETFDQHGPGMATEPLAGEQLDTVRDAGGVRYVLSMQRPIVRLIVRVQALPAQTLVVSAEAVELMRFGERALELTPDCGTRKESR